jgi:hypothetical protein
MTDNRRWSRRRTTGPKAQRALDALMALVHIRDCPYLDPDARRASTTVRDVA